MEEDDKYKRGYVRQKKRSLNAEGGDVEKRVDEVQMEGIDDVEELSGERESLFEGEALQLDLEEGEKEV